MMLLQESSKTNQLISLVLKYSVVIGLSFWIVSCGSNEDFASQTSDTSQSEDKKLEMNNSEQEIREFYERLIEAEGFAIDGVKAFMQDNVIGRAELVVVGDWGEYAGDLEYDAVEIEQISTSIPLSVSDAFERNIALSEYTLSHVFAFKARVSDSDSYAIGISGVGGGDGRDTSGHWIEIFDSAGKFLGSSTISDSEPILWRSHPIQKNDFNISSVKQWSEEIAIRVEEDGAIKRLILGIPQ